VPSVFYASYIDLWVFYLITSSLFHLLIYQEAFLKGAREAHFYSVMSRIKIIHKLDIEEKVGANIITSAVVIIITSLISLLLL
jgi:hypothetical protein